MRPSVLRRPNHQHPLAPFAADDLAAIERRFEEGFDAMWRDERGMTCAMEAASKGHSAALSLALSRCKDPAALALARSASDLDAFDMAAAAESTACMAVLSKRLPAGYKSSIGRGLLWHAAEAARRHPALAESWLADLCSSPGRVQLADAAQALAVARSIDWKSGVARLERAMPSQA